MHAQYTNIADFKVGFHNLEIRVKKDARGIWHKLPHLVPEEDIVWVINKWPSDWLTPFDIDASTSSAAEGSVVQMMGVEKKKDPQRIVAREKVA